jgi:L-lactate utilization protein LutB
MDEHLIWHRRTRLDLAARAFEKNGFGAHVFDRVEEAVPFLMEQAAEAQTVGFGGSMTLAEMGLPARCEETGKKTLVHGRPGLTPEQKREVMGEEQRCDLFFTGTNALTLQGQLVNIDGVGNRVCAMAFGPKRVIVVAGVNKITHNLDSALRRVKDFASPPNAKRLNLNTPCASTGLCSDCNSPDRICRITTIIDRAPRLTDIQICLINDDLGY